MGSRRQKKVADLVHQELSLLLGNKVADPRLAHVTFIDVEMSSDLQLATIHYSVFTESQAELKDAQAGLESATGFFRKALAESLNLRTVPALRFRVDQSMEHGRRIDHLLDSLRED